LDEETTMGFEMTRKQAACQWLNKGLIAAFATLTGFGPLWEAKTTAEGVEPVVVLFTQVPVSQPRIPGMNAGALAGRQRAAIGARVCLWDLANAQVENLTLDFTAAAWPAPSFDAKRMLFVGRRNADDADAVFELSLEDRGVREVPLSVGEIQRAIYLPRLYTLDDEEPAEQIGVLATPWGETGDALFTCRTDGTRVRRITFAPRGVTAPTVLKDGRLLIGIGDKTSDAVGQPTVPVLFSLHTDGTDLFPFAGLYDEFAHRSWPCEIDEERVVFFESPSTGGTRLAQVMRTRSLRTRREIGPLAAGAYEWPSRFDDSRMLVSYRNDARSTYALGIVDLGNAATIAPFFDDPQYDELAAVRLAPRPPPAGRSSSVDERLSTGQLYCFDSRLTDQADGPPTNGVTGVRIIRAVTSGTSGHEAGSVSEQAVGQATVETDGSFFLEVPAKTPLRMETIDAEGNVVRAMRSWTWVMPGEDRGCIGCHEDRERTPPNRHVLALRKSPQRIGVDSRPALPVVGEAP
jgi:hypothetical protein